MIRNALIAIYILAVLAISVSARATILPPMGINADESLVEALQNYNYQTHVGEIVAMGDGSLVLILDEENFLPLQSDLDLTPFIGFQVMISGIELEHQLAPRIEIVDPLPGFNSVNSPVVFFVFGISEVR